MPIDASILNEVEHLRELKPEERTALAEKIDLLRYAPGENVFQFGDPGNAMYIVRSGEVEIFVKNDQARKSCWKPRSRAIFSAKCRCSMAGHAPLGWWR
jgi:hypothetical protein